MTEILIAALPALFALAGTVATALLVNRRSTALILYRLDMAEKKLDALAEKLEKRSAPETAFRGRGERVYRTRSGQGRPACREGSAPVRS